MNLLSFNLEVENCRLLSLRTFKGLISKCILRADFSQWCDIIWIRQSLIIYQVGNNFDTKIGLYRNAAWTNNKQQSFLCDKLTLKLNPENLLYYLEEQWSKTEEKKELAASYILRWRWDSVSNRECRSTQTELESGFKLHIHIFFWESQG